MDKLRLKDKRVFKEENQRKIIFFSIFILVIVLLVIFNLNDAKNIEEIKLEKLYSNLIEDNNYSLELVLDENNTKTISRNENSARIDTMVNKNKSTTIVQDGDTMLLNYRDNTYHTYKNNVQELNKLNENLETIKKQSVLTGTEKIKYNMYSYEEYTNLYTYLVSIPASDVEEFGVTTRFYFKNNSLTYIKNICGEKEEFLKVTLNSNSNSINFNEYKNMKKI